MTKIIISMVPIDTKLSSNVYEACDFLTKSPAETGLNFKSRA